jgi:hypothetical protein
MNTIMTMGLQVENDKGFAKRLFAAWQGTVVMIFEYFRRKN